jgi:hypothetical protein
MAVSNKASSILSVSLKEALTSERVVYPLVIAIMFSILLAEKDTEKGP